MHVTSAGRPPSPRTARSDKRRAPRQRRRRDSLVSCSTLLVSSCGRCSDPPLPGRYRPATVTAGARVPRPGAARGRRRRRPVRLGGPRQRATLAILLLNANRVVPVERLADELYAGRPPVSAVTQVQRQVSELRRVLGSPDAIETRPPGYLLRLRDEDARPRPLRAADRRGRAGARARRRRGGRGCCARRSTCGAGRRSPTSRTSRSREPPCERLEELRLAALEERDRGGARARAARGARGRARGARRRAPAARAAARPADARALPLPGDRPRRSRSYRATRQALVESFGIEPSAPLQALERAILRTTPALELGAAPTPPRARRGPRRAVARRSRRGARRAGGPRAGRARPRAARVRGEDELAAAAAAVGAHRPRARTAAFTSDAPAADLVRLATANDADLVLVDAPPELDGTEAPGALAELFERSPGARRGALGRAASPRARASPCRSAAASTTGPRSSSPRALASSASGALAARRHARRPAQRPPRCEPPARRRLARRPAARRRRRDAGARRSGRARRRRRRTRASSSVGISPRWRHEGIGAARRALVRDARPPVLLVHRGPRPGVLAPRESRTRFTWTLA